MARALTPAVILTRVPKTPKIAHGTASQPAAGAPELWAPC